MTAQNPSMDQVQPGGGSGEEASIIVIAYNNGDSILECLSSLSDQTYQNKRILVVCDRSSSDDTEAVVDDFVRQNRGASAVKCDGVGRSRARNLGWQAVGSPVVMFADGDDVYERTYLEKAMSSLQSGPDVGGVCLGGRPLKLNDSILSKYYESFGATDARHDSRGGSGPGWAWVYRRECVEKVRGFDEGLAQAEDKEICMRVKGIGYRIAYVGGTNWYRRKPEKVRGFLKKEYLGGKRRTVFELKTAQYGSIAFNVAPIAYVILSAGLADTVGLFVSGVFLLLGVVAYALLFVLRRQSPASPETVWFILLAVTGRLASGVGSVYGLLVLGLVRLGASEVDLGRF